MQLLPKSLIGFGVATFLVTLTVLPCPILAQEASSSASPSPSLSPSPSSSATNTGTTQDVSPSPSPSPSASPEVKQEVLGTATVLGSTGTRDLLKLILIFAIGLGVFFVGLKIVRNHDQE